jgi:hypothetical protein
MHSHLPWRAMQVRLRIVRLGEGSTPRGCSPGLITTTSMPKGVSSRRRPSDMASSPALLAEYAACSAKFGTPFLSMHGRAIGPWRPRAQAHLLRACVTCRCTCQVSFLGSQTGREWVGSA